MMNVSLVELVVLALAVWEALEIWHHSSLLANLRDKYENLDGRMGELFRCMFCMAPWTALLAIVIFRGTFFALVIYALAVARLANLGNDLTHHWCRTPKIEDLVPPSTDPSEGQ